MTRNPVGWFEIYVDDMKRAKDFYETVFEKQLMDLEMPELEMWAFPTQDDAPGASGSLVRAEGFPPGANSTLIYFTCDDCAVEARSVSG